MDLIVTLVVYLYHLASISLCCKGMSVAGNVVRSIAKKRHVRIDLLGD
jgi:hypothetical protein